VLSWSGEPESLGVLGEEQNGAVMALGSWSPWGYLGKNKTSLRHGPWGVGVIRAGH
jgi:hypothetical protein